MKLQSLRWHGLTNIADGTLPHMHRLVITGPTGAGKSTIADLVQLALAGASPRGKLKALAKPSGAAVVVGFEHGGKSYRATLTSRKGKEATALELVDEHGECTPVEAGVLATLGVTAEVLDAACFLRCHGADGHGAFGPSGPTGRRVLLTAIDGELPSGLLAEWAASPTLAAVVASKLEGAALRAASMPERAKDAGRRARAALESAGQVEARIDETQRRMVADEATAGTVETEPVDVATAEAELDAARRQLSAAQAEAERVRKLRATREQLIAQRSDARAKLDAMGEDVAAAATAKLEALRKEWFASRDRGVAHATEANTLTTEANAIESRMLDAWAVYRDAERVYATARSTAEAAAEWLRQVEAEAGPVHVPCGARKEFHACAYLTAPIKARAELPAAKTAATSAAAALAAMAKPEEPAAADKATIENLRARAAELRRLDAECRARCAAIAKESEPLKAIEAAGNAPADRLRVIIATPIPDDPGEAPDCAPWVTLVTECEGLVRELRAKRNAQAGAEALRSAAAERVVAARARIATLQTAATADRGEAEAWAAVERFCREAPRLAIKGALRAIEGGANAFLERAGVNSTIRLEESEPDARGLWDVAVYVGGVLRETLSEGQLLTADLALSAGYRALVGLGWAVIDDGFGALDAEAAQRIAAALDASWVITHKPEIACCLVESGWTAIEVTSTDGQGRISWVNDKATRETA